MICGVLELENIIQIGDKTRLACDKSFATKGEADITLVEIQPEDAAGFIDVTGEANSDWYLDWIYTGPSRVATVSLRITTDDTPVVFTKTIQVVTAADDKLFSADTDLTALEPDVMKWVPEGRASWLHVHRAVQAKIIDWLNKAGIEDTNQQPLTVAAVVDVDEVKFWSRDWALALIYKGIQNSKDDVFDEKAKFYMVEAVKGSDRARIRLDLDGDGLIDPSEAILLTSSNLVRG